MYYTKRVMAQKNDVCIGTVIAQGKNGDGVMMVHGMPVYVANTVVGDTIECRIVKCEKRRYYGKLLKLLTEGPDRVTPLCGVSDRCGGCQLQHQRYESQLTFKAGVLRERLSRYVSLPFIAAMISCENPYQTRNKIQCAFDGVTGQLGLYAARSHRVIPLNACVMLPDAMNAVIAGIHAWHQNHGAPIFNEKTGVGVLRYVTIRYAAATNELMVILTTATPFNTTAFCDALSGISGMTSIYTSIQASESSDAVLGASLDLVWGRETITDCVGTIRCSVSPRSFMQANYRLVDRLYGWVLDHIAPQDPVADLYCGTGILTCLIAKRVSRVVGVDNNPDSIANARENALQNGVSPTFICADVATYITGDRDSGIQTVILDPPRKGCSALVLDALIQRPVPNIIYISCCADTLGRDLRHLCQGGYHLETIQGVDMFCHTSHIEAIAVLRYA
jgi:23S rRNA (uracil1939-C5)-methyltransferase